MSYPRVFATATGTYDGVAVIGGNMGKMILERLDLQPVDATLSAW